jgi:bifunctional non-homologous end joining protein LigD
MARHLHKKAKHNRPHFAAIKAPMPASLEPMLPTLIHQPFSDPNWIYEPKWDGWRALCFIRDGQARFLSRKKNSLNERFPELRDIAKLVKADTAILDGEIVTLDEQGIPRFEGLQHCKQQQ